MELRITVRRNLRTGFNLNVRELISGIDKNTKDPFGIRRVTDFCLTKYHFDLL
jgi:hypothetical protein